MDRKTNSSVANVGYARVSTIDQDPALQLDALTAAGCAKISRIGPREPGRIDLAYAPRSATCVTVMC